MGKCLCDLTANMCDHLCCCDPDCTQDEVNNWLNSMSLTCKDQSILGIIKIDLIFPRMLPVPHKGKYIITTKT
jgi:hypothetical protein